MIITIDTAAGISELDRAALATLLERTGAVQNPETADPGVFVQQETTRTKTTEADGTVVTEEKPAPRRRAAAKKVAEPVAEEAPEEPADETPAVLEDAHERALASNRPTAEEPAAADDAPTLEDAVAAATPLISAGKAAVVKAALANAGVKRVGELPAEKIAAFIEELKSGE